MQLHLPWYPLIRYIHQNVHCCNHQFALSGINIHLVCMSSSCFPNKKKKILKVKSWAPFNSLTHMRPLLIVFGRHLKPTMQLPKNVIFFLRGRVIRLFCFTSTKRKSNTSYALIFNGMGSGVVVIFWSLVNICCTRSWTTLNCIGSSLEWTGRKILISWTQI